jgi:hypothetical protein
MRRTILIAIAILLAFAAAAYGLSPGDRVTLDGRQGTVQSTWDDGDYVVVKLDPTATPTSTATPTATATPDRYAN